MPSVLIGDRTMPKAQGKVGPTPVTKPRLPLKKTKAKSVSNQQAVFIEQMIAGATQTEAARKAGFSQPDVYACELLNPSRFPLVVKAVQKGLAEREAKAVKTGDDILRYIHTAMFYNPLQFFEAGEKGGWLLSEEKYKEIPPQLGCLIEEIERREVITDSGSVVKFWVKLVSKTVAMSLAAKHQLGEKISVNHLHVNWDDLAERGAGLAKPDPLERRIELAALPAIGPVVVAPVDPRDEDES